MKHKPIHPEFNRHQYVILTAVKLILTMQQQGLVHTNVCIEQDMDVVRRYAQEQMWESPTQPEIVAEVTRLFSRGDLKFTPTGWTRASDIKDQLNKFLDEEGKIN